MTAVMKWRYWLLCS